jgi:L-asparaginase / beta-aspartyl-peptidase
VLLIVVGSGPALAVDFDYHITGNSASTKLPHREGGLMLLGGGRLVDDAFRWFIRKAGGGHIVVLSAYDGKTANGKTLEGKSAPVVNYETYLYHTIGGCDSVERIDFHNREAAADPTVLKVIKNADGVFFGGGVQ